MKYRFLHIILLLIIATSFARGQKLMEKSITLKLTNATIENILEQITKNDGINFSYKGNLPALKNRITIEFNSAPIDQALAVIFSGLNLNYIEFSGQIIIIEKTHLNKTILIKGRVCDQATMEPIPFATIESRGKKAGIVADLKGFFQMEIKQADVTDSLYISSLSYLPQTIVSGEFTKTDQRIVFLSSRIIEVPEVSVIGKENKFMVVGNHKWFVRGALYMDTHGQQTALYINNTDTLKGKLVKVNYYLSQKGNTDAPFRVRIYRMDSLTGKPGTDLLTEMIVVKPSKGKGWYSVNVARFNIGVPANGFFVAMEGVYPDDYEEYYSGSGFKDISKKEKTVDDFAPESITFGQQLGYTGGSENNTWHYSIDHNWFQLKKRHFNVMISAEIKVARKKWWKTLLHLFVKN